jgi:iodotyrosine deiodinase
MGFLNEILGRPSRERSFLILVVGYPAERATVPAIGRKPLEAIATFV